MTAAPHNLGPKQLRTFALTTGALFAAIFGVLLPWLFGLKWPLWPWVLCLILATWGMAHPASLRPVHAWWMRFAEALGWVNNRLILGALFFALITPMGWVRRRLGGDPMTRRYDASTATYRKPKDRRSRESLERPF